jgi:hypothetical protein
VVLADVSFALMKGRTKIILGASGGQVDHPKIITGLRGQTPAPCW